MGNLGKWYPGPLKFGVGAKVLAAKPTGPDSFSVQFYPATVASEAKECERIHKGLRPSCPRKDLSRREYEVTFDDDKGKVYKVYEELIVPLECFWSQVKDTYTSEDKPIETVEPESTKSTSPETKDKKETNEQKESLSEKKESSSESDESESSSGKKEKKHHKHHKHHSHSKKDRKHRHHSSEESPSVIIMPIFIPYGGYQPRIPYFYQ